MKTYSISELSKKMGIPSSTLRYYEDARLLTDVERTCAGQRIYTEKHVGQLEVIECFKGAGMTLDELRDFLKFEEKTDESIDSMISLLDNRREILRKQIEDQITAYKHLLRKLDYYDAVKKSVRDRIPRPGWDEYAQKDYPSPF